jgi:hypothetical protein
VTKHLQIHAVLFALALALSAVVRAEGAAAFASQSTAPAVTPLKVQVVISRFQGEKKMSSLPYTLSVNATTDPRGGAASLRMGARIPVMMMAAPQVEGQPLNIKAGPIQYQDVGTNIDCMVWAMADGRFRVEITIDDTSIYPDEKDTPGVVRGSPSFRSFRASDAMLLKDGATGQFTTATDKVSGEITKVDVTLTVVK